MDTSKNVIKKECLGGELRKTMIVRENSVIL